MIGLCLAASWSECTFEMYVTFNNFSVIFWWGLIATGNSVLTFIVLSRCPAPCTRHDILSCCIHPTLDHVPAVPYRIISTLDHVLTLPCHIFLTLNHILTTLLYYLDTGSCPDTTLLYYPDTESHPNYPVVLSRHWIMSRHYPVVLSWHWITS